MMKYFFALFGSIILAVSLNAQNVSSLQVGVNTHGIAATTSTKAFNIGIGQQAQLWLSLSAKNQPKLSFSIGFRSLNGYRQKQVSYHEAFYPNAYHIETNTTQLLGLSYLDLGVHYHIHFRKIERMSLSAGLRYSNLYQVKGQKHRSIAVENNSPFVTASYYSNDIGHRYELFTNERIGNSHFQNHSLGLGLHFYYQITPGLSIHSGLEQDVINAFRTSPFPNEPRHFITTFFLGLSARMM